jgi:two-component system, NtrC family, response regulator GlrR
MNRDAVLLVDDDPDILRLMSVRLAAAGYRVEALDSAERALAVMALARPRLVITDLKLGGMDGLALFEEIHRQAPTLPVIILTAHGTIPDAVEATQRGVFGFLPKPFDGRQLLELVAQAFRLSAASPEQGSGSSEEWRGDMVTRSPRMEDLLHRASRVAQSDASVLIRGPSGSGKELLARAIHRSSARAERAFVAVNCAAIPEGLLESELFGHRRGAFTGAAYDHKGLIPAADGGTLFLDEIGDMPLSLQAKLLRVLEERIVRPVGATQPAPVDLRVISATHRDLEADLKDGRFREDLYYRLNVVSLELPALAERREDIVPLAAHFLAMTAARYGRKVEAFAPDALELLLGAPWPGNVRQLLNVVEQVVALGSSGIISASLVQQALREEPPPLASLEDARRDFERDYLVRVLRMAGGNVTQAAKLAQRNRTELYRLLNRHRIEPAMFKNAKA